MRRTWSLLFVVVACGSKHEPVDKPAPPDMSGVVKAFESPDGVFDQTTAQAILDRYASSAKLIAELGLHESLVSSLRASLDEAIREASAASNTDDVGTSRQALTLSANGTMAVTRVCDGWESPKAPRPENGKLTLRVNFSEKGLDPVLWGDATDCRYLVGGVAKVSITEGSGRQGDVRMWLGGSATFENFGSEPILFDTDLAADVEGVVTAAALGFRIDPKDGKAAVSVAAEPGRVVVSPVTTGSLTVLASNGDFDCDVSARSCSSNGGQSFTF